MDDRQPELRRRVRAFLQGGRVCIFASASPQGEPHTSVVSWALARDEDIVALALDSRSRHLVNLRENPRGALEVLGDDLAVRLTGPTRIVREEMESSPFPSALVELQVEQLRDHGVAGLRLVGPRYDFDAAHRYRQAVEQAVYRELRGD
ncbi:MAG: pyridoxamine 5'-phosphate oxidase family protein [Thermaerobacter sp.]|jgi:hypothetical protein|nr:pyridoxamine 5'-phosphate oxidase family protein [Thermaerobacter sp.]